MSLRAAGEANLGRHAVALEIAFKFSMYSKTHVSLREGTCGAGDDEPIWTNYVRLEVHFVNFPSEGVIVSKANNYGSNRRLLKISHVALRAPRKDRLFL
jgi:hypothetical protein